MHDIVRHMTEASYQSLGSSCIFPHPYLPLIWVRHHVPVLPVSLSHRLSSQLLSLTLDCLINYSVVLLMIILSTFPRDIICNLFSGSEEL